MLFPFDNILGDRTYISTSSEGADGGAAPRQSNLAQHFPTFVWAVRDHHLELEIDGKSVTSDEYLEFCLKFKPGHSAAISKYNGLRDAIRSDQSRIKTMYF